MRGGAPRPPVVLEAGSPPTFPDPRLFDETGLVAVGGDLSVRRLVAAYRAGIFPWFDMGYPPMWWSPDPRAIIEPGTLRVSRSLRRVLRASEFELTWNTRFERVMGECGKRRDEGTWIIPDMVEGYARLHRAGVKIAIQTGGTLDIRMLPYEAAVAVTYGLPWDAAIRALTIHPAEIFGVDDRIGSLRPGLEATLIVTDGDPLQPLTRLRHLMIAGRPVPLSSRHTELYEKWRD